MKNNLPLLILCVVLLSIAAHAQTENVSQSVPIEMPPLKREFKLILKNGAAQSETNEINASTRRQTYVRPSKEARLKRFASDTFGVPALIGAGISATVRQITDTPPEWGNNIGGFGRRLASGYGTNVIRGGVTFGLSEAFKLDNRYEKLGGKNIGKRIKHAFIGSYTTRTKTGKRIPDFAFVTGTYTAHVIANEAWFPNRYSYKDGLRDGTISIGTRFGITLLREFFFSK